LSYHKHVKFFFFIASSKWYFRLYTHTSEVLPKLLKATSSLLATGSKITMFDLDKDNKAIVNVVAYGVIVSLAEDTFHGWLIEEGNVYVRIFSIVPGAEVVLLYGDNNNDDSLIVRLGDALNFITKWPMEPLKTTSNEWNN
jgi:hypothetical protein